MRGEVVKTGQAGEGHGRDRQPYQNEAAVCCAVCVALHCQCAPFYARDDMLLSTDAGYPLWFMVLLAGVKYRPYQDRLRDLFHSASPSYIHFIHYCIMTSPPYHSPDPRREAAYSTGVTYFLKQQLKLYRTMTPASEPVASRACGMVRGAARML